ncbi:hypothetical protein [uncultured Sunxiuqinia sp.]|uniref:hypothetical protein n=1 Tax=uncultured Sunxiuqinia sp. TaxID=1573825 RepID=UPI002621FA3C|nr:hypothetical protein [uncultured Sunxiuqinia sp.]
MKTKLQLRRIGLFLLFLLAALLVTAQPDSQPDKKKHLKLVKIENGEKTVMDTVLLGDASELELMEEFGFTEELDSILKGKLKRFNIEVTDDGENQEVFVFSKEDDLPSEWFAAGDSVRKVVRIKRGNGPMKREMMIHTAPHVVHVPKPPHPPMAIRWHSAQQDDKMVIRLDDPGVISYKKKDLRGGREKIEIIRQKPVEHSEEMDVEDEIILEDNQ